MCQNVPNYFYNQSECPLNFTIYSSSTWFFKKNIYFVYFKHTSNNLSANQPDDSFLGPRLASSVLFEISQIMLSWVQDWPALYVLKSARSCFPGSKTGQLCTFWNQPDHSFLGPRLASCVPQLPHSYYFTTCILVLKLANKGIFLEEIQDSHFPRKMGYFSIHLRDCGEKGVNFDVQFFTVKKGVHLGWKSIVLPQKKEVHFELKSQCFIAKRRSFCA